MSLPIAPDVLVALTGQPSATLKQWVVTLHRDELADIAIFSQKLQEQGWLTAYQAGHLAEGRGEGLIVGQYVVLDELGHGSVGMVYKVRHRIMGRQAALKVFTPESEESENYTRFMREIQATAQLDHPNIIKAYEAGEHHGAYFLAMELVDGQNLQEKVDKNGPIPWQLAVKCHLDASVGLGYAHSLGMIHRDVKPGNIMLGHDGRVRVLDLGLVKFTRGLSNLAASMDGTVRGTAAYMAPEQGISIRNADHRSDIYSLGSSLYFTITGQPMFTEKTVMQQLLAHQKKLAPSIPNVPDFLNQLYLRMVAKNPAERLQSMAEVMSGLQAIAQGATPPTLRPQSKTSLSNAPVAAAKRDAVKEGCTTWKRLLPFWGREKPSTKG
jgi:serine/threonine protein kinase